jgi:hypothetical protein
MPQITNYKSLQTLKRIGDFDYDSKPDLSPAADDDLITLGPYELDHKAVFEGQWKNGLRHGKGKQIWDDGSIYEGYWSKH